MSKWGTVPAGLVMDRYRKIAGAHSSEYKRLSLTLGGVVPRRRDDAEGLQPTNFEGYQVLPEGSLVFKLIDLENVATSRVGLSTETGIVSPAYIVVQTRSDRLLAKFGYYAFWDLYKRNYFNSIGSDGVRSALNYSDLARIRIPLPPLENQQRIADYLDRETAEIDAAVAALDRYVELLKSRTKNLLQHLISTKTSESDLRPIWSLFEPVKRLDHPHEEVLSVYRDYGVVPKDSREDNRNRTPEDVSTYQLVLIDDLVVNKMKAWQGSLAVSEHRGIVSPDYQVAQPITDNLPKYLHYALRCQKMVDQYLVYSNGIRPAQWRLYWEELSRILVPIPAVSVQNEIIRKLDQETAEIDALIEESTKLRDLLLKRRSVLITEVVTGRKQV